jgi:5-oxoprolinase (ATP-hydrolysing)
MERLHNARFPSRNVRENEADILAALASLRLGGERLKALAAQCGTSKLLERMDALRHHSKKLALQALLQAVPDAGLSATGRLDDGTPLCVRISRKDEQIHIDFSGTGPQHPGNLNANPAIVASVVLYVIRLLIQKDIPLNEGILEAVLITIPAGSILSPDFTNPEALPAVVGGNTETSQKLAAVLINALNLQAGGQSTMNNVLFGNNRFGYYETIGGGSGAGPGFHGAAGIHTHMTNTALTDAEILERRYPVRVWEHSIRKGSGGGGRWRGGEGVRRVLEFLEPLTVSVLAESRIEAPFGKCGGGAGATGSQTLISPVDGVKLMPSNFSVEVAAGTKLILETPGGGGWGSA